MGKQAGSNVPDGTGQPNKLIKDDAFERWNPACGPKGLRQALGRFVTGITVITTRTKTGVLEGLTVNSFSALSLDPPLVIWSLRNQATSFRAFTEQSNWFAVNVLGVDQQDVSGHFGVSAPEKFAGFEWQAGLGGCPLVPSSLAVFECRLESLIPGGDHVILIGRVERAAFRDGEPLLFHAGGYCVPQPVRPLEPLRPAIPAIVELSIEISHFL